MSTVLRVFVLAVALLHGWIYLRYATPHPCQAARLRIADEGLAVPPGLAGTADNYDADTILQCYRIALAGGAPAPLPAEGDAILQRLHLAPPTRPTGARAL